MSKRKRRLVTLGCVLGAVILILFILSRFIAISTPIGEKNEIFSVVFDKASVSAADKIVLIEGKNELVLTDKKLVRELAREFVVANNSGQCGHFADRWMLIYNGDKLVRNIRWNAHADLVVLYKEDSSHLVAPGNEGQLQMSDELTKKLDKLFEKIK